MIPPSRLPAAPAALLARLGAAGAKVRADRVPGVVPEPTFFSPTISGALASVRAKMDALRARDPAPGQGHRAAIRDAVFSGAGFLWAGAYSEEELAHAAAAACAALWGRADEDDLKWIDQAITDGRAQPLAAKPDTPGQAADPTVAALSDPGAEFDFAFLDPDAEPEPPEPARYGGFGGAPLFYGQGVHWLQGESESGKSMVALAGPVLDAIRAGGLVLYVDHEDTRARVQERLRQLGASGDELRRVCYVPASDVTHAAIVGHLTTSGRDYAVMVVDGVTSALSAAGLSGRDEQELTQWVDDLPRRARMAVCVDHVVKAQDARAGMAIGSQAKKAVVTGTAWEVVCTEKFGRGTYGQIMLEIQKDKPGWVRGAGVDRVRLHVISAPGTYALSVRVADGSVADPFEVWLMERLRQGYTWSTANALWRAAKESGHGVHKSRMREQFARYEQTRRKYESISHPMVPVVVPSGGSAGTTDHEKTVLPAQTVVLNGNGRVVVPSGGSAGTTDHEKTVLPAQTVVLNGKNHPEPQGTGSGVLTPVGENPGTLGTQQTNGAWPAWLK